MEKIVFRKWLERRDLLVPFLRNALNALDERDWGSRLTLDNPVQWINKAFLWETTPEGRSRWAGTCEAWKALVHDTGVVVEAGMPLEDETGLRIMAADLEAENEKDRL